LPDAFRTVFVMRDIEEASTEETASVLGIRGELLAMARRAPTRWME
jgi:DNA-directed RNA polymerase specialized sigma24 family protein